MIRVLSLFMIFVLSCSTPSDTQDKIISKVISVKELHALIKSKEGLQLIDVRTNREYKSGHLSGAVLMDYYQPDFKSKLSKLDKNKPVAVYCAVGGRSNSALKMLKSLGFNEAYDLAGGIRAWQREKLPIEK